MKGFIGWTVPFFYGWLWIFPKQEKLLTVIGKPIWVQKTEKPTKEQIDDYHTRFKTALLQLHEKHRALGKEEALNIVK
jgi:diacylglycerol O-acyltransferase 2-like protein 3/2-acylglycerol O-acyltransferase 2